MPIGEEHGFCGFVVVDRGWWWIVAGGRSMVGFAMDWL